MIITLAEFKLYNNLSDDDTEDTLITQQINYAQIMIENYLGYNLESNTYTFLVDGNYNYYIPIPIKPINSLTSISVDSVALLPADFILRDNHIIEKMKNYIFTEGIQNVIVVVNAGYITIPSDIKGVCLEIASLLWSEKGQNIGVTSRTIDEYGTRVFVQNKRFDDYLNRLRGLRILF